MTSSRYKRFISFFLPLKMWRGLGSHGQRLELILYQGQWQLTTDDAIYSDGWRYQPLRVAFGKIRKRLPFVEQAVFLGSGIGSGIMVLRRMGFVPQCTLVDHDEEILNLARSVLQQPAIRFSCMDAEGFVHHSEENFDLLVIDIFEGRVVPGFVSNEQFLLRCRQLMRKDGIIVVNFMVNQAEDGLRLQNIINLLPRCEVIDLGVNKVILFTA